MTSRFLRPLKRKSSRFRFESAACSIRENICNAFEKLGYVQDHQTGSHIILRKTDPPHRRLTIPNHKEVAKGTLRAILRQAGLTLEEFKKLL